MSPPLDPNRGPGRGWQQTIYRWWPSKAAVLLEHMQNVRRASAGFPDTGDHACLLRARPLPKGYMKEILTLVFDGLNPATESGPR